MTREGVLVINTFTLYDFSGFGPNQNNNEFNWVRVGKYRSAGFDLHSDPLAARTKLFINFRKATLIRLETHNGETFCAQTLCGNPGANSKIKVNE